MTRKKNRSLMFATMCIAPSVALMSTSIGCTSTTVSHSQEESRSDTKVPDIVSATEAEVHSIDLRGKKYRKVEKELTTGTDGGGHLLAYFQQNGLAKMDIVIGLSNGNIHKKFYLKNNQIVLIVEEEQRFLWNPTKGTLDPEKVKVVGEEKYYFKNGEMVYWRSTEQKERHKEEDAFSEKESQLLNEVSTFGKATLSNQKSVDVEKVIKGTKKTKTP